MFAQLHRGLIVEHLDAAHELPNIGGTIARIEQQGANMKREFGVLRGEPGRHRPVGDGLVNSTGRGQHPLA